MTPSLHGKGDGDKNTDKNADSETDETNDAAQQKSSENDEAPPASTTTRPMRTELHRNGKGNIDHDKQGETSHEDHNNDQKTKNGNAQQKSRKNDKAPPSMTNHPNLIAPNLDGKDHIDKGDVTSDAMGIARSKKNDAPETIMSSPAERDKKRSDDTPHDGAYALTKNDDDVGNNVDGVDDWMGSSELLLATASPTDLDRNRNLQRSQPGAFAIPGIGTSPQIQVEDEGGSLYEFMNASVERIDGVAAGSSSEADMSTESNVPTKSWKKRQPNKARILLLSIVILLVIIGVVLSVSLLVTKRRNDDSDSNATTGAAANTNSQSQPEQEGDSLPSSSRAPSPDPSRPSNEAPSVSPSHRPSNSSGGPEGGAEALLPPPQEPTTDIPSQSPNSQPSNGSFVALEYGFLGGCFYCGDQLFWKGGAAKDDLFLDDSNNLDCDTPHPFSPPPFYTIGPTGGPPTDAPTVSSAPSMAPSKSSSPSETPTQMPTTETIHWLYHPELSLSALDDAIQDGNSTTDDEIPLNFGVSPVLTKDWVIIGSVFVYRREYDIHFHQRLFPNNGSSTEPVPLIDQTYFGLSIKTDGSHIVVGAAGDVNDRGQQSGAAFVFEYLEDEQIWVQTAKLTAPDNMGSNGDRFGYAVAIAGNTIAVGECSAVDSNVWIFERNNTGWSKIQMLEAGGPNDDYSGFGCALAMDDNTLLVGAPTQLYPGANDTDVACGSVHIYGQNTEGLWNLTQILTPLNCPTQTMGFGSSLDIDLDAIVVGAPLYGPSGDQSQGQGSFFIFEHNYSKGLWEIQDWIVDHSPWSFHQLGSAVAIDGGTVGVGARWTEYQSSGRVELYTRDDFGWTEQHTVYSPSPLSGNFGTQLALHNNTLIAADFDSMTLYTFVSTLIPPSPSTPAPTTPAPTSPAPTTPAPTSLCNTAGCLDCLTDKMGTGETGCVCPSCETTVCDLEPFCCDIEWDGFCQTLASDICVECGGVPCGFFGCLDCLIDITGEGGCMCPSCEATVCGLDSHCCDTEWDGSCQALASDICVECVGPPPPCDAFSCLDCLTNKVRTGIIGCMCPSCEAMVCGMDSYCCDIEWDGHCQNLAFENCGECAPTNSPTYSPTGRPTTELPTATPTNLQPTPWPTSIVTLPPVLFFAGRPDWPKPNVTLPILPDITCPGFNGDGFCGNCITPSRQTTGCEVVACRCELCHLDPYCCGVLWDSLCSEAAEIICDCN